MGVDFQRGETKLYLGLYEVELNVHLRRLTFPGCHSFDIGGQYGYDALVLAKLTGGPVVTVDCDPALCVEMRENVSANPSVAGQIDVRCAFAGTEGLTLDELARQTFYPDLIKIDVEGGEVDVLASASVVLSHRPGLIVEVHSVALEAECRDILKELGYAVATINPRRWLPDHRPIAHNRWLVAS